VVTDERGADAGRDSDDVLARNVHGSRPDRRVGLLISFTAIPWGTGKWHEPGGGGHENYWRGIMRSASTTSFIENLIGSRIAAGESIVLSVPPMSANAEGGGRAVRDRGDRTEAGSPIN
jgi:hypothetical protein